MCNPPGIPIPETATAGDEFGRVSCFDSSGGTGVNSGTATAIIGLRAGHEVECTFSDVLRREPDESIRTLSRAGGGTPAS